MGDEAKDEATPARPHVGITGDVARIAEQFRKAGLTSRGASEQVQKSLRLESAEWMKQLRESSLALTSLESLRVARESVAKGAIADLRGLDLPRIDPRDYMLTRSEPLKVDFPKPLPRVMPAGVDAANRQIRGYQGANGGDPRDARWMETRDARSEALAEERAKRADSRAVWQIRLAVVVVLYAFVDLFLR